MENYEVKTKVELNKIYKTQISKLDQKKLYIIHVKLDVKGINLFFHPYAFLIQTAASINNEYGINHTALIYGIYKDKILGKSAKYIEATPLGLRSSSFWSLVDEVHSNKGEIWIEEVCGIGMDSKLRKWVESFIEKKIMGQKYSFLKAIASQDFKNKFLAPLGFIFALIGKIFSTKDSFFCTEIVKIIIDQVMAKSNNFPKGCRNKEILHEAPEKLYPSEFFGKFGQPKRFL